jgi:hypothetical protein
VTCGLGAFPQGLCQNLYLPPAVRQINKWMIEEVVEYADMLSSEDELNGPLS